MTRGAQTGRPGARSRRRGARSTWTSRRSRKTTPTERGRTTANGRSRRPYPRRRAGREARSLRIGRVTRTWSGLRRIARLGQEDDGEPVLAGPNRALSRERRPALMNAPALPRRFVSGIRRPRVRARNLDSMGRSRRMASRMARSQRFQSTRPSIVRFCRMMSSYISRPTRTSTPLDSAIPHNDERSSASTNNAIRISVSVRLKNTTM
jgi:hypothetical protein